MIYLTYGEPTSGVYSSQVIDVVKYLNQFDKRVRLIAFISLRQFKENKAKILKELPGSIVFPMLPKATYWQINVVSLFLICLINRERNLVARNVIATNMALRLRKMGLLKKVCFDGRGAIAAEWKEYDVMAPNQWLKTIDVMEKKAVIESDFRIAVSNHLVNYWQEKYGYKETDHVIIPCTVNSKFVLENNLPEAISNSKSTLGIDENDIVFAYSGSTTGWQSFKTLESFIAPLLNASKHFKIIFLAKQEKTIDELKQKYPEQVFQKWVSHEEVTQVLTACDYGILIREETVTNRVASPTKFAEYLASGLPVVISDNLGDYSSFVETHQCGIKFTGQIITDIRKPDSAEKERMKQLVLKYFTKEANQNKYEYLLKAMQ